jgi:hypothetical protein
MRRVPLTGFLSALLLLATGCVTAPPPGTPVPPAAQVLEGDSRAFAFGRTGAEVTRHPEIQDKLPSLFGADWAAPAQGRGQVPSGAAAFFARSQAPRMVKIGGTDYIAVTGCAADACSARRVLLLIREGGNQLLARLDDGPISHYYAFTHGADSLAATAAPPIVDAGVRALRNAGGNPYPS